MYIYIYIYIYIILINIKLFHQIKNFESFNIYGNIFDFKIIRKYMKLLRFMYADFETTKKVSCKIKSECNGKYFKIIKIR